MQLASIPRNVMSANEQVAGALATAHKLTERAQVKVDKGDFDRSVARDLSKALEAATQAREGVVALGQGNLLNDTFQRYATHSVRHLKHAVSMIERKDGVSEHAANIFKRAVFDSEVSTRLGSQAAERSLKNPSPQAILRASSFGSGESIGSSNGGPVWVDGEWLDSLGNPVRGGGDSWAGPDGEAYGWDGSPVRGDGGWVGPDGEGYSGI